MMATDTNNKKFLPIFSMDWFGLLRKLEKIQGNYGVLSPINCSLNFLRSVRSLDKLFFLDGGIFRSEKCPWYFQPYSKFNGSYWERGFNLAAEKDLRQYITDFFNRCDQVSPDYVFAPDVFGEPLLSLYLARIALNEYSRKLRTYKLIGVVQAGYSLYHDDDDEIILQNNSLPLHYQSPRSFLAPLISEYHNIGYKLVALGGLLKVDSKMPTGWKFGLSNDQLDALLLWSRPDFVLGGLALTRLDVLRKHNVWADSTNWLWWDARYDHERFGHRNAMQEVVYEN